MNYPMIVYPIKMYNGRIEWAVEFPDLPGCVGGGDTPEEAVKDALATLEVYLDEFDERGDERPVPTDFTEEFSDSVDEQIPVDFSYYNRLSKAAEKSGMELADFVDTIISGFLDEYESEEENNIPVMDVRMNKALFVKLEEKAKKHGMDLETYIGYVLTKDAAGIVYPQQPVKFNYWDFSC